MANFFDSFSDNETKIIEPTSISKNKDKTHFVAGDTYTLDVTFSPTDSTYTSLSYSSSDTTIARVSSTGQISFLKGKEVTITITSTYNESLTDNITFIVDDVYPSSIRSLFTFKYSK